MPGAPNVYILILNWNSLEKTAECVKAVEKLDYTDYKVVLIDNASPDGSGKILQDRYPQHCFIQTGKNKGYAGGNNAGMKFALTKGADYIWILNPDVRVEPDSLKLLVEAMEQQADLGIAGPVIEEHEPSGSCRKVFGWRLLPETGWEGERNSGPEQPLDYVYGCSFFMKRKMLLEIGFFREEFFMYSEEKEFCLRAKKHGWKLGIVEKTINRHYPIHNPQAYYYCCRNALLISRLEKRRRFKTLFYHLEAGTFFDPLLRGRLKEALFYLRKIFQRKIPAIFAGLFTSLGPVPQ